MRGRSMITHRLRWRRRRSVDTYLHLFAVVVGRWCLVWWRDPLSAAHLTIRVATIVVIVHTHALHSVSVCLCVCVLFLCAQNDFVTHIQYIHIVSRFACTSYARNKKRWHMCVDCVCVYCAALTLEPAAAAAPDSKALAAKQARTTRPSTLRARDWFCVQGLRERTLWIGLALASSSASDGLCWFFA